MFKSTLQRIVTPPSLPPSSSSSLASTTTTTTTTTPRMTATAITEQALASLLYQSVPSSSSTRMKCITTHPCLPQIAYVVLLSDVVGMTPEDGVKQYSPTQHQLIVVQNVWTRQVLWKLTLSDLTTLLMLPKTTPSSFSSSSSAAAATLKATTTTTKTTLGQIQALSFYTNNNNIYNGGGIHHHERPFQYLLVQFSSKRIVIVNLMQKDKTKSILHVPPPPPPQQRISPLIVANISQGNVKASPTTMAIPLTSSLVVMGCVDGALRVYDYRSNKVIRSVRGPSGKDSIWNILNVTPNNNNNNNNVVMEEEEEIPKSPKQVHHYYILAISSKGAAYMWDIIIQQGTLIDVRPPLVKLEGPMEQWTNGTTTSSTSTTTTEDAALDYTSLVQFNAHDNILTWYNPKRIQLLVWNLHIVSELKRKLNVTPRLDPILCLFSNIVSLAEGGGSGSGGPLMIVPCWNHPSFPAGHESLTCAVSTLNGEFHVVSFPIYNVKPGTTVKAISFFSDSLTNLIQRHAGMTTTTTTVVVVPKVKVQSMTTFRRLDTTSVLIGTNVGLLVVSLQPAILCNGARHAHFGAGFSEWNKSILTVQHHSTLIWAQLDIPHSNPCGAISFKKKKNSPPPTTSTTTTFVVYQSPPALHLPLELQKRAIRLPPRFLPSPSGTFLCLYWQHETRYEILHLPSILRRHEGMSHSPAVSSGSNVLSFAWVGDDDVFALLYPASSEATRGGSGIDGTTPSGSDTNNTWASPPGAATSSSRDLNQPFASKASGARGLRKSFNFMSTDKARQKPVAQLSIASSIATTSSTDEFTTTIDSTRPRVELKILVPVVANAAEISGSISAATVTTLGDITLRGGNRNPPTTLFGGPVLCVASKPSSKDSSDGGTAYFYTRKPGTDETRATAYISSGPTLPYLDFCEWDDDGRLCAVVVQSRVAIYLSEAPEFVLLGNVQLGSPAEPGVTVTGIKFIHGVLYCSTKTAVQCIFLGNLEQGVCHLDTFVLASADRPSLARTSWAPPTIPMTLNHPIVLGYQSGSLLLSTVNGLQAIPLSHPVLRIGALLAAGEPARAQRWFDRVPESHHEALANFVQRRGAPELCFHMSGLSLETMVDLCLLYGFTNRLEELIDLYGLDSIRKIDLRRGQQNGHSLVVCVGSYLLSQGKAEMVRRLATECLRSGEEGKQDAFVLASLLLTVDRADARRLVKRAVSAPTGMVKGRDDEEDELPRNEDSVVLALVRKSIL